MRIKKLPKWCRFPYVIAVNVICALVWFANYPIVITIVGSVVSLAIIIRLFNENKVLTAENEYLKKRIKALNEKLNGINEQIAKCFKDLRN